METISIFNKPHKNKNNDKISKEIHRSLLFYEDMPYKGLYSGYLHEYCFELLEKYFQNCPTASGVFDCRFLVFDRKFCVYFKEGKLFGEYFEPEK